MHRLASLALAVATLAALGLLSGCPCDEPTATVEPPPEGTPPEGTPPEGTPPEGTPPRADDPRSSPLYIRPDAYDFRANPRLLARIRGSAHGYFRFVNVPFSDRVCVIFADALEGEPMVNLHGDAHLEQYVVTNFGRGMSDYDDSSIGPSVIDLVRFGTSVRLAAEAGGYAENAHVVMDEFLRGYRAALDDPTTEAPEPALARRIREGFTTDRAAFIADIERNLTPLAPERRAVFDEATRDYFRAMRAQHPDLGPRFFDVVAVGTHALGIGSALDDKYLVRVRGPTAASGDDVVIEAKEVRDLSGVRCLRGAENRDPFRVLVAQARIAYQPYPYLGHARIDGKAFWIHGWAEAYHEIDLEEIRSAAELREIAYDIGVQLGRGHVKQIAAPLDDQLRAAQRQFLDENEARLAAGVTELAAESTRAWRAFVTSSESLARELLPADTRP